MANSFPNYNIYNDVGLEGQIAYTGNNNEQVGTAEGLVNSMSTPLPFGRVIVAKPSRTYPGQVQLPSATGQSMTGVSLYQNIHEKDWKTFEGGYPSEFPVTVLRKGIIFMIPEENLAVTDTLYFRHTMNSSPATHEALGRIRNDADTSKADAFTGAKLLRAAIAGQPVPVDISKVNFVLSV